MTPRQQRITPRVLADGCQYWCIARDGDKAAFALARRHYSAWKNKRPKIAQFMGPGESLVLVSPWDDAVFGWRVSIREDGESGVCCSIFRNESPVRSSVLIRAAESLAWAKWPQESRLFTHVDPKRVQSANPGWCFIQAGWTRTGRITSRGLLVLEKRLSQGGAR